MPLPIVCASDLMCQFLEMLRPVFSKPQWKYFETVLLGLLHCDERQTMSGWLRAVCSRCSLCGMSRFLRHAPWSATEVAAAWIRQFHHELIPLVQAEHASQRQSQSRRRGRPKCTRVTGALILDDSVQVKPRGQVMRGLGRHYSSCEGKVVTGHNLFQALYVVLGRQCPLQPRMYRTKKVCERDKEPFFSKIDLAVQTIQQFEPISQTHTLVLADSWYVCKSVWKVTKSRNFTIAGGIKCNRKLRLMAADGTRRWQRVDAYAESLSDEQWTKVLWPSDKGGIVVEAHSVRTLIHRLGACQFVCVRRGESIRYFVTSELTASLEQVIEWLALRWEIETFFEDLKELLGTDHYQVLHDRAILRIWTLACCLYRFLATTQATSASHVSIGQCRRSIRDHHRFLFLTWLQQQFQDGLSPAEIDSFLAS